MTSATAAPTAKRPAKKNPKATAKKQATSPDRNKSGPLSNRRATAPTPGAPSDASDLTLAIRKRTEAASPRAAVLAAQEAEERAAELRRTAAAPQEPTRTSPPIDQPAMDPAELRAALARRQSWTQPRSVEVAEPAPKAPPAARPAPVRVARARPGEVQGDQAELIREALRHRGTPYVWGGASRGGFDCSGFICMVFKKLHNMDLPHSASAQSLLGRPVPREDLRPGDVVFFSTYRPGVSHVGIYIGGNKFIHAANRRKGCRIDSLTGYYDRRYKWARRYLTSPSNFSDENLKAIMKDTSEIPFGDD